MNRHGSHGARVAELDARDDRLGRGGRRNGRFQGAQRHPTGARRLNVHKGRPLQLRARQVRGIQDPAVEIRTGQIRAAKVRPDQRRKLQHHAGELRARELSALGDPPGQLVADSLRVADLLLCPGPHAPSPIEDLERVLRDLLLVSAPQDSLERPAQLVLLVDPREEEDDLLVEQRDAKHPEVRLRRRPQVDPPPLGSDSQAQRDLAGDEILLERTMHEGERLRSAALEERGRMHLADDVAGLLVLDADVPGLEQVPDEWD